MKIPLIIMVLLMVVANGQDNRQPDQNTTKKVFISAAIDANLTKLRVGMPQEYVLKIAGQPLWKGKTFLGDTQWNYLNKSAPVTQDERYRRIWLVFTAEGKIKEVLAYSVCYLYPEHLDIKQNLNPKQADGNKQPNTRPESK